jgi:hypothetical protein
MGEGDLFAGAIGQDLLIDKRCSCSSASFLPPRNLPLHLLSLWHPQLLYLARLVRQLIIPGNGPCFLVQWGLQNNDAPLW